jgi:hypothetical protein
MPTTNTRLLQNLRTRWTTEFSAGVLAETRKKHRIAQPLGDLNADRK